MRWTSSRLLRQTVLVIAAVAAPLACGGGGDDPPTGGTGSIVLTASPATLSLQQGMSGTVTLSLSRSGGFAGAVSVSVTGLPTGVTTSISPDQITGSTTSATVTVNVAATVAPGTYTATARATATGVGEATTTYTLTVTAAPNFTLTANPATLSIAQGASANTTIAIARTSLPGAVALSLVAPPAGVTGTFNPASSTTDNSALTVNVAATTVPGSYNLTVQGSAAGVGDRSATIALTVTAAGAYTLSVNPTSVSLAPGGSATTTVGVARLTGFAGAVTLALDSPPTGITASFAPSSVTGDASTMTVNVAATVVPGNYTLTIRGTAAGATDRTTQLTVVVAAQAFTINLTPATTSMVQGTSTTIAVAIGRTNFTGAVGLALDTPPPGFTGTFAPGSTTGTTSTLTLNVAANTTPGIYTLTVRGTSAGQTDRVSSLQVTVTAAPGSIAVALTPSTISVQQGSSGIVNVALTRVNFTADVTFSATGAPGGVTVAFNPVTTPASATVATITVAAGAAVGTTPITITATGTGVTAATATLTLNVTSSSSGSNSEWQFCSATETPIFFAFQDGTGAWQRVTPSTVGTVTKFAFALTQNRGGVAYVMQTTTSFFARDASDVSSRNRVRQARALEDIRRAAEQKRNAGRFRSSGRSAFATTYETEVFFGTATELTTLGVDNCTTTQVTKSVSGTVTGIAAGQVGTLSLGGSMVFFFGGVSSPTVAFQNVPLGTVDFVGTRLTAGSVDKAILMRNLNVPDGGALPSVIDFDAASAFAPATATATVNTSLGDSLSLSSLLTTANGETGFFSFDFAPSPSVSRPWAGLPANKMVAGDVHGLLLSASPANTQSLDSRILLQYVDQVTNQTMNLGPNLTEPTATILSVGAYPRFRFQGTLPIEYRQGVQIDVQSSSSAANSVHLTATGGYLSIGGGSSVFDLSMPDIAGLNGFPTASRLTAGANLGTTTAYGWSGQGILAPRPRAGDLLRGATRSVAISVP
jgi:hypothetical protein